MGHMMRYQKTQKQPFSHRKGWERQICGLCPFDLRTGVNWGAISMIFRSASANRLRNKYRTFLILCSIAPIGYNTFTMQHYIVSNPNILDGEPVIVGTRVPVVVILQFLKEEYTFEEIR